MIELCKIKFKYFYLQKNAQQVTTVTFPIFFAKHKIDHSGGGGGAGEKSEKQHEERCKKTK